MPASTTTTLAGLIPHELMSGVLLQSMGDHANLRELCNNQTGFVAYKFGELNTLTAAGVVEGAALTPAAVTPIGTRVVASPVEVPAIQLLARPLPMRSTCRSARSLTTRSRVCVTAQTAPMVAAIPRPWTSTR